MSEGRDYFITLSTDGGKEQRQVYCSALSENTRWYLITVMPRDIMNDMVTRLDRMRIGICRVSRCLHLKKQGKKL